ncbi:MAG: methionine adenosyltransferase [Sphaerochaetaceae bacterium]|nr:methionine adenosyltransferase [Sphaerochaetaceae bacterium]
MKKLVTSESVCKGHPDKLCDLISDTILDACLEKDKKSRVACEVLATAAHIIVAGEITCKDRINIKQTVKGVLLDVGYNPNDYKISVYVHTQSSDIAGGVDLALEVRSKESDKQLELGAGDQGTVFGYATNETKELLPLPLLKAHAICKRLDECMSDYSIFGIGPDGKAQVSIEYEGNIPIRVSTIVISVQQIEEKNTLGLKNEIIEKVINPVFIDFPIDVDTNILINPSGKFVLGGPAADTGLTGRKIIVDTYGGLAAHGGGAFSGKDPTKVDRSAAYMARAISKNIVRCGFASKCQTSISYAIGKALPVALEINTFGTSSISESVLENLVLNTFDLRPSAIIKELDLRNVKYAKTATYGHFNNIKNNTWEYFDKTEELMELFEKEC